MTVSVDRDDIPPERFPLGGERLERLRATVADALGGRIPLAARLAERGEGLGIRV